MLYVHNDHLATPQIMSDSGGNTVWSSRQDAFGEMTVNPDSAAENNLRFPGQYYDSETGLHYNWWRYYDPGTGRYVTVEPNKVLHRNILQIFNDRTIYANHPIVIRGLISYSDYNYAFNEPSIVFDPDGKLAQLVGGGLIMGGILLGIYAYDKCLKMCNTLNPCVPDRECFQQSCADRAACYQGCAGFAALVGCASGPYECVGATAGEQAGKALGE